MGELTGKVAVVTGAAGGIGRAIALDLALRGAQVLVCDIADAADAVREVEAAGGRASGHAVDMGDADAIARFAEAVRAAYGRVDILVNNAGLFTTLERAPFDRLQVEEWRRVLDVNVTGPFLMCRALLPLLRESDGGRIVNITSATVFSAPPMMLHYVASKGALTAMTRSLARELGKDGITVNAVAPGFTLSSGVLENRQEAFEAQSERARASRCIQRDQMPGDVVGAVAFLASPASAFITGQTLVVDGGVVMR